jgi:putative tryptophan/tyrosine transport system substrate-binding protein
MKRREFITLLGGTAAWPLAALGQQPGKLPLIGVLVSASPPHPFADAFWRGLHALGYSEGRNIKVEFRYTEGRSDRAEEFAEEFVQVGVNVIVAHYAIGTAAAMAATRTIPIVMVHGAPLQLGVRVSATSRTAVYGPVRTVVWEGRSRKAPPYPDP